MLVSVIKSKGTGSAAHSIQSKQIPLMMRCLMKAKYQQSISSLSLPVLLDSVLNNEEGFITLGLAHNGLIHYAKTLAGFRPQNQKPLDLIVVDFAA